MLTKSHFKKYKRFKIKSRRKTNKRKTKLYIVLIFLFFILLLFGILLIIYKLHNKNNINEYKQDDLTIVSAYYKVKSKHKPEEYYGWISNFVLLNKSIVFFTSKEFMPTLKELRPKELYFKTVFIELEMEEFYAYKIFITNLRNLLK